MSSGPITTPRRFGLPAFRPVQVLSDSFAALDSDPARRIAFKAVLVLLFLKTSTVNEIIQASVGARLYLLYIVAPPALLGMVIAGGIQRTLRHRVSWLWVLFTCWMVISVPFSFWVGGSARAVFSFIRDDLSMMFLIAGTVASWPDLKAVVRWGALGAVVPMAVSLIRGGETRTVQLAAGGTIANANDLAAHLLLFLPLLVFLIFKAHTPALPRAAMAMAAALQIFVILRTGSRGGLIATAITALVYLSRATTRERMVAALLIPVAIGGALLMLPAETLQRLTSFSQEDANGVSEALASMQSREYLLRKSIEYTFRYPIFGIGVGQFSNFEGTESRESGLRGNWHVTHNAYTQVSSESGTPALLFFLAAIGGTFLMLVRVSRKSRAAGHKEMSLLTNCLISGFSGFCVAIVFLSLAYTFYLPAMTGIAIALHCVAARELQKTAPAVAPPAPAPWAPGRYRLPARRAVISPKSFS